MRYRHQVALLVAVATTNSGCGILLQTAFGWTQEQREVSSRNHTINVRSRPEGATVTRAGPDGSQELGTAPLVDSIAYQHETVTETPSTGGLLIGGGVSVAAAIGAFVAGGGSGDSCAFDDFSCVDEGPDIALFLLGGTLMYFGVQDLIIALFYGLSGAQVKANRAVDAPMVTYTASMPGKPPVSTKIKVPDSSIADLIVDGSAAQPVLAAPPPPPPPPPVAGPPVAPPPAAPPPPAGLRADAKKWVIAVMDVEDINAKSKNSIDKGLVRNLGDQLRIFIAQTGVKTIDRSAQERALQDVIDQAKSASYKACYDDSCQIELGKALAASHILRSRITRFGSRCVLNAELIDLRAEVTIKASSARGGCAAEGFLNMSEEVANNLVR
jgi:hypothetical protein